MKQRYKVTFIYRKSNHYISGRYIDNAMYNFYFKAMKRNPRIDIEYACDDNEIDLASVSAGRDALIFMDVTRWGGPDRFLNADKVRIPKLFLASDCHDANYIAQGQTKTRLQMCQEMGFDYYYDMQTANYFYRFWPREFRYKWVSWGIERELFDVVKPFRDRTSGVILNTGNLSDPWYSLRKKCNDLEFVRYVGYNNANHTQFDYGTTYVGDRYVELIQQYQAAIAAIDYNVCCKQIEIPAAGCLCFLQVDGNDAAQWGYEDGKTAVFINYGNYVDVMKDYLKTHMLKRWEEIAAAGREYVLNHFTNDILTNKVVDILDELNA